MKKIVKLSTIVLLCTFFFSAVCTGGNQVVYKGTVSGVNGGTIVADSLAITFPRGIATTDIRISIEKNSDRPSINGTKKQIDAYNQFRFIGSTYKITANPKRFDRPYVLTLNFDPAEFDRLQEGEIPIIISISNDGILDFPEVLFPDLPNGLITVKSSHFSHVAFTAAPHEAIMAFATNKDQLSRPSPSPSPESTFEKPDHPASITDAEFNNKTDAYKKAHPPAPPQETITAAEFNKILLEYRTAKDAYYAALKSSGDKHIVKNIDGLYKTYKEKYDAYIKATQKKMVN